MKIKRKKITLVLQKLFSCLKNSWRAVVTVGSCSPSTQHLWISEWSSGSWSAFSLKLVYVNCSVWAAE